MGRKLFDSYLTESNPDEQALVVAAGGSYYYAKKDLKGRKLDPAVRESRLRESAGNGNGTVTCESIIDHEMNLVCNADADNKGRKDYKN